jgi:hypothetical protein
MDMNDKAAELTRPVAFFIFFKSIVLGGYR